MFYWILSQKLTEEEQCWEIVTMITDINITNKENTNRKFTMISEDLKISSLVLILSFAPLLGFMYQTSTSTAPSWLNKEEPFHKKNGKNVIHDNFLGEQQRV